MFPFAGHHLEMRIVVFLSTTRLPSTTFLVFECQPPLSQSVYLPDPSFINPIALDYITYFIGTRYGQTFGVVVVQFHQFKQTFGIMVLTNKGALLQTKMDFRLLPIPSVFFIPSFYCCPVIFDGLL